MLLWGITFTATNYMTNQFSVMISLTKYCVNIRKKTLDLNLYENTFCSKFIDRHLSLIHLNKIIKVCLDMIYCKEKTAGKQNTDTVTHKTMRDNEAWKVGETAEWRNHGLTDHRGNEKSISENQLDLSKLYDLISCRNKSRNAHRNG